MKENHYSRICIENIPYESKLHFCLVQIMMCLLSLVNQTIISDFIAFCNWKISRKRVKNSKQTNHGWSKEINTTYP